MLYNCIYFLDIKINSVPLLNYRGVAKTDGSPEQTSIQLDPAIFSTLRQKQRRLVRENPGVLSAITRATNMAINECQYQFRNRRWNCSTRNILRGKNLFGKIVERSKLKKKTINTNSIND